MSKHRHDMTKVNGHVLLTDFEDAVQDIQAFEDACKLLDPGDARSLNAHNTLERLRRQRSTYRQELERRFTAPPVQVETWAELKAIALAEFRGPGAAPHPEAVGRVEGTITDGVLAVHSVNMGNKQHVSVRLDEPAHIYSLLKLLGTAVMQDLGPSNGEPLDSFPNPPDEPEPAPVQTTDVERFLGELKDVLGGAHKQNARRIQELEEQVSRLKQAGGALLSDLVQALPAMDKIPAAIKAWTDEVKKR